MQDLGFDPLCRCAALRAQFQRAPRCGVCERKLRREWLLENGWVESSYKYRQAFLDCGVPVETIAAQRGIWVPCWAEQVRQAFMNTADLGPILGRCAVDPDFAEAIVTVRALVERAQNAPAKGSTLTDSAMMKQAQIAWKMRAFAIGQGVSLVPPPGESP